MDSRSPVVKGRCVEIDLCEPEVGFVLSIGVVSVWLSPTVALDLLETLARAIAVSESTGNAPGTAHRLAARHRTTSS